MVVVAVLVALTGGVAPSSAQGVEKVDARGDASARLDISRVVYRNLPGRASARVVVPRLVRDGTTHLVLANPGSDWAYVALVRVADDGTLRTRFVRSSGGDVQRRSCRFTAAWDARANHVDISVPRRCLKGLRSTLYLQAATGLRQDYAPPARRLPQG
ncbi:hypothetical protein GCM10023340_26100 [Nocardioides marinquilinus]|uniref:SH3 domain-containing protein n=1 Tax=Nocardioides marinquilinus TaxID=1210400 RepID=A0ABP9PRX9_9ACTN